MKKQYALLLTLLLISFARAQDNLPYSPPSESGEVRNAGSELATAQAIKKASLIFIAQIEVLGVPDLTDAGVMAFRDTTVKVTTVLKGKLAVGSEVQVSFFPMLVPKKGWEAAPKIGSSYIFFVKKGKNNDYQAIKLLNDTDSNLAKVKQLMAAAPASN